MSIYDHLVGRELASGHWTWDADRALLYAVGVGAGLDDPQQEPQFTTENTPGQLQQVIPSFATVMGLHSDWMERLGWTRGGLSPIGMVHGEQSVTLAPFGHMDGRFSRPLYPGDRLETFIWTTDDEGAAFQMVANGERIVLDRGLFRFRDALR